MVCELIVGLDNEVSTRLNNSVVIPQKMRLVAVDQKSKVLEVGTLVLQSCWDFWTHLFTDKISIH